MAISQLISVNFNLRSPKAKTATPCIYGGVPPYKRRKSNSSKDTNGQKDTTNPLGQQKAAANND